jgi:hypothetical protein
MVGGLRGLPRRTRIYARTTWGRFRQIGEHPGLGDVSAVLSLRGRTTFLVSWFESRGGAASCGQWEVASGSRDANHAGPRRREGVSVTITFLF